MINDFYVIWLYWVDLDLECFHFVSRFKDEEKAVGWVRHFDIKHKVLSFTVLPFIIDYKGLEGSRIAKRKLHLGGPMNNLFCYEEFHFLVTHFSFNSLLVNLQDSLFARCWAFSAYSFWYSRLGLWSLWSVFYRMISYNI